MMDTPQRTRPPRQAAPGMQIGIGNSGFDYTLQRGAVQALDLELSIVIAAADRLAAGYRIGGDDLDRLHAAHQFLIRILANLRGVEVTQ